MKIAHFSDLHIKNQDHIDIWLKLFAEAKASGAQHFAVTGDVLDGSNTKLYKNFITSLREITKQVSIVCGNHDIFGFGLPGNAQRKYNQFIKESGTFIPNGAFPYRKKLGKDILVYGLDTTPFGWKGRLNLAMGNVESDDMLKVAKWVSKDIPCKHKVLLMHHMPFKVAKLGIRVKYDANIINLKEVRDFLKACEFDLILCGHGHWFEKRKFGNTTIVLSGSDLEYSAIGYRIINLGKTISIKTRKAWV